MRPMKDNEIALIQQSISARGGLEKHTLKIAAALVQSGSRPSILMSTVAPEGVLPLEVSPVYLPLRHKAAFLKLREFNQQCLSWKRKHSPKIFFGMERISSASHVRLGNGSHRTYLTRMIEASLYSPIRKFFNPLHRSILQIERDMLENPYLEKVIANSYMVKGEVIRDYSIDPNKIIVIHNGVEWEDFAPEFENWVETKNKLSQTLGLDPHIYQFLFVGNGYERKGLFSLLEGLSLLKTRDYHLSILGKEKNMTLFKRKVKDLRIDSHVTFFGPQNPLPFYKIADCLVVPSVYDPFANVTIEALAMGLFVISSKYNGGKEILNEETGKVIDNLFDPESICHALQIALQRPKTWISSEGIRSSVKKFDFSLQLQKVIDICLP